MNEGVNHFRNLRIVGLITSVFMLLSITHSVKAEVLSSLDESHSNETVDVLQRNPTPKIEIWTGSLANASVATIAGTDVFNFNFLGSTLGSGTIVGMPAPSVGYLLNSNFEVVFSFNLNSTLKSTKPIGSDSTVYQISAGIIYSLGSDFSSSYFARLEAGMSSLATNGNQQISFLFTGQLGKRFKLAENVGYVPVIVFEMITTLPSTTLSLSVVPLQFSFWL